MQRELNYRLRQQSLLADLGVFALRCRDLDTLFREVCRRCALGLDTELSKVLEYIPERKRLLVRAGIGWRCGTMGSGCRRDSSSAPTRIPAWARR